MKMFFKKIKVCTIYGDLITEMEYITMLLVLYSHTMKRVIPFLLL